MCDHDSLTVCQVGFVPVNHLAPVGDIDFSAVLSCSLAETISVDQTVAQVFRLRPYQDVHVNVVDPKVCGFATCFHPFHHFTQIRALWLSIYSSLGEKRLLFFVESYLVFFPKKVSLRLLNYLLVCCVSLLSLKSLLSFWTLWSCFHRAW